MSYIPSIQVVRALSALADGDIPYRLLRNTANELPDNLKIGKDIDILARWNDFGRLDRLFKHIGFRRVLHPLRGDQFLYGVHPFRFYKNSRLNIFIDVHFELACRSLNQGEWIPLDRAIQARAWAGSSPHHIGGVIVAGLPRACECLHLLTRCIFDKREFDAGYLHRIEELTDLLSDAELLEVIQPVFFKFSMLLLKLLRARRYEEIIMAHSHFMDY